ncbi:MAG: AbrB/MazE/SpoVT family DNA-binding domain-containing protein [Anaerolineales bacterium]|nr:AbrB/MazE/SpoVT family DNA-binding domain-containing protein [Anaerolineales bacterium]
MLTTVRVQEKGQVTIPRDLRRRLRLRKGDMVTFIETSQGVVICPVEEAVQELQQALEKRLAQRGQSLGALMAASQEMGGDQVARKFGLDDEAREMLYQVLQLRAQIALEAIRKAAEANGSAQLGEEDIDAEIRATRRER